MDRFLELIFTSLNKCKQGKTNFIPHSEELEQSLKKRKTRYNMTNTMQLESTNLSCFESFLLVYPHLFLVAIQYHHRYHYRNYDIVVRWKEAAMKHCYGCDDQRVTIADDLLLFQHQRIRETQEAEK